MNAAAPKLNQLLLAPQTENRLGCIPTLEGKTLSLRFGGVGEAPDQAVLGELLKHTHSVAQDQGVAKVQVSFEGLQFMNSSCFKAFVSWIAQIVATPTTERYTVHFKLDPARRWQRVSVAALSCFAVDLITFE